jgi:hypothetical protein
MWYLIVGFARLTRKEEDLFLLCEFESQLQLGEAEHDFLALETEPL